MQDEFNRLDHSADIGLAWLIEWNRVVQLQAERVALSSAGWYERRGDAFLFVMALRQVERAARMVLDHEHDHSRTQVIREALLAFEENAPGVKDTRDVLEHFDEYELGSGRLSRGKIRLRDWIPTAESAAEFVIDAGLDDGGQFVVRCGPHEISVHEAAAATSGLCRIIQRLTYVPAEHETPADFDPTDLRDPRVYAMSFCALLSQLGEQSRASSEIREDLTALVAPEITTAWGDFTIAAQMIAGMGMGSFVDYDGDDVAYVKFVPDVGEASVLSGPVVIPNGRFLTLQRRSDLPLEWYVCAVGAPVAAGDLPWPGEG